LPIKVLTQGDDDGDGEDGDDEASPSTTENDAMDRVERGDEDNDVGLIDNNADEEAPNTGVLPERRHRLILPPSRIMSSDSCMVGPPIIFLDLVGAPSNFLDMVGPSSNFLDLAGPRKFLDLVGSQVNY
jgi:hypothetical protein